MKILLLNLPGKRIYTRDYYCSKVSKSDYIYHPTDLLLLSGTLDEVHEVKVLDAIAERMDDDECLTFISDDSYDVVIFLTGSVSWEEDCAFLKKLNKKTDALLIGTGDVLLEGGCKVIENSS